MRSPDRRTVTPVVAGLLLGLGSLLPAAPAAQAAQSSPSAQSARAHGSQHRKDPTYAAQVLTLVNRARSHARSCGSVHYSAVGPVRFNARLHQAARSYSVEMGRLDFVQHVSPRGVGPGQRISAAGYRWDSYGENIAAGYGTPGSVVRAWLGSPGHCANIMTAYHDVGVGYADLAGSRFGTYWVMDFATH